MGKDWFSSKELTGVAGLPCTTQGVNRRARIEKWRSRQRTGVQGKAIEYHVDSLPRFVQQHLQMDGWGSQAELTPEQRRTIWLTVYAQLSSEEQERVLSWLWRYGLESLLSFITQHEKNEAE